jgi:hypothetical protein
MVDDGSTASEIVFTSVSPCYWEHHVVRFMDAHCSGVFFRSVAVLCILFSFGLPLDVNERLCTAWQL